MIEKYVSIGYHVSMIEMKQKRRAYVGLGGNIGDTPAFLREGLKKISLLPDVHRFQAARFYQTSPVSFIPQRDYINTACSFDTSYSAVELLHLLQQIEKEMGKVSKSKEMPRIIDCDLLFFGEELHEDPFCQVPHPRWQERLFVLIPLADLTHEIRVPQKGGQVNSVNILEMIANHENLNNETIKLVEEPPCI